MHEAIVAQSLLDSISGEAAKYNTKPISAKISCGQFNAVNEEVLRFAFEALAKGTVCEGMKLYIRQIPLQARCTKCGFQVNAEGSLQGCPNCGQNDLELLADAPLLLEEIELEEKRFDDEDKHSEEDSRRE